MTEATEPRRGKGGDLFRLSGVDVGPKNGGGGGLGVFEVVDAGLGPADGDYFEVAGDEEAGFEGVEVEDVDAIGGDVDHLFAVGGVGVVVEIEAGGIGFVGETADAMAGVGVDPGCGGIFGGPSGGEGLGGGGEGEAAEEEDGCERDGSKCGHGGLSSLSTCSLKRYQNERLWGTWRSADAIGGFLLPLAGCGTVSACKFLTRIVQSIG